MANQLKISYDRSQILGKGSYGNVFLGKLLTNEGNNEVQVAVKRIQRIPMSTTTKEDDVELTNMSKLGMHPNVVTLLHWEDQGEDFRFYALELCDVSLQRVYKDPVKYRRVLPSHLEFMLQLCLGLEYIHSQNLIHRDIKPANVLIKFLNGIPIVKWADFGLSKTIIREECILSGPKGTELYWAPEIWKIWKYNNRRLDKSKNTDKKIMTIMSDIFSSGCVFFEFCTGGVHPFGDGSDIIINLSMEQSNPYNLKELKLKQSHFAYKIIKKMLENEPKVRPYLREIIPSLLSLKNMIGMNQNNLENRDESQQIKQIERKFQAALLINSDCNKEHIDEAQQKLEEMKKELHYLCSRNEPTEEQIGKIVEIVARDSIGLVNMVDDDGFSPLILMCRNNKSSNLLRCIKALLSNQRIENGANGETARVDVNYQDRNGYTAFMYICRYHQGKNFLELFQLLNQHGIDLNKTDKIEENDALAWFFLDNQSNSSEMVQIVKEFIKRGVNLKHKSGEGWTSLHHLCRFYAHRNLVEVAKLLIDNGVDVKAAEQCNGWTALHFLCRYYTHDNLIDVVKLLIGNGADVTAKQSDGWNALHILCGYYSHDNLIDLVKLMMENGAVGDHLITDGGHTASDLLHRFPFHKHGNTSKLLELLISAGVESKNLI